MTEGGMPMTTTATTYHCQGSVRGRCAHAHRTLAGALRCLHADQAGCREQGGYSDRAVYDATGVRYVETETDSGMPLLVPEEG